MWSLNSSFFVSRVYEVLPTAGVVYVPPTWQTGILKNDVETSSDLNFWVFFFFCINKNSILVILHGV